MNMQHRKNRTDLFSHYLKIFILLEFYVDFLQKLGEIERVYNFDDKVEKQRFADMDRDILFSVSETSTTVTDARGNPKEFTIENAHAKKIINSGYETTFGYDENGLIKSITYPGGNKTEYEYDSGNSERRSQGNLRFVRDIPGPSGGDTLETEYKYESWTNQVNYIKDPRGFETNIIHDSNGNIKTVTPPENPPYVYEYYETGEPKIYGMLKSITDPTGSVTEYTYYPESSPSGYGTQPVLGRDVNSTTGGYLESIIIDKGGDNISQRFEYDPLGNITKKTDGAGVETHYLYDNPFGEVTTLIQGATQSEEDEQPQINLLTTFAYDKNGNIIGQMSRGITTEYEYDRLNRLRYKRYKGISGEGEIVQEYEFKYDNNSNLTEIIYPNKVNKETFTYNTRDLLQSKTSGIGDDLSTIGYTYNNNGQIHILTDGEGHDYEYKYDGHGRFKEIIDPLENKVTYDYDANSNVTSIDGTGINCATLNQQFEHDSLNRLTYHKILKESGVITTRYGYNDASYLNSITTPNLHQWGITPTGSGLAGTITDPMGNVDTNTYDKRGWLKTLTETEPGPDGKELTNNVINNVVGNPVFIGDSVSRDYNYIYNQQKQVLDLIRDPEDGIVTYEYDGLNRLHKVIRHISYEGGIKQSETRYEYDANGNLEKIFDYDGNETSYVYDTKDRLKYIFYPGNVSVSITYNGNDQVDIYTDMNGSIIDNEYDDAGHLVRRTISPSQEQGVEGSTYESFEYDGLGRLTKASNNVSEVWFIYDKAGRLEKEIQKLKGMVGDVEIILTTNEVKYGYDDNGNVTELTYPSGKILTITPEPLDRIGTISASGKSIVSYTYEGKGKVLQKTLQNAITMDATFDNGRRPLSLSYKNNEDEIFFNKQMDWNLVDLKNSEIEGGKGEKYKYDTGYRLRKVTDAEDNAISEYDIDGVENIDLRKKTQKGITEATGYVYNERHQLVKYNGKDLIYDKNGNLKEFYHQYIYDWKNQLVKVITGTGVNVEYNYDALGRRIEKIVTDPLGEAHTRYIYDGYRVIEEHDKDGKVVTRYTYGNGIDEPLEIEKDENNDGTLESYIPMQNTIGSVIGVADNTGKLLEKVNYDDYGTPTFIYDEEAPQVNNIRIESGKIFIRFSEPVDKDSAENAVKLKKGMDEISGTFQFDEENSRAIFIPSSSLPQNETLTIIVTTDLKGPFGNKLANEFSKDFIYTGSDIVVYDRVPPEVEVVKLKSGEFIIEFDEEIDSSSITDSIKLTSVQGTFAGSITQEESKTLKFVPENNLSNSVEYTINVKTTLTDLSGKNLSNLFTEKFINTGKDILIYERPDPNEHEESIVSNNVLFQGRNFETETGLYYFRARYFHPVLKRFLQTDPMGYEDSLNLYQAFNQNPVNFTDPMGKMVETVIVEPDRSYKGPGMHVAKYYDLLRKSGLSIEETLDMIAQSPSYAKYFWDGSLVERIKTFYMDVSLTESEERSLGIEYNITLKGPREQFGRLFKGEFKEFGKAALENLDRTFSDPEGLALIFSGGVKCKGAKPYPFFNKKGILQWKDRATGRFTKAPVKLPEGVNWPKGVNWEKVKYDTKDITSEYNKAKDLSDFYDIIKNSTVADDFLSAFENALKAKLKSAKKE
jgi:RHS repeat-associated protein